MSALIPVEQIAKFRDATPSVMKLRLVEQEVTQYWSLIFSPKGIATLTKEDMTSFLSYRTNKRWREISREDVTQDMEALRKALLCLVDEDRSIAERLNELEPGRGALVVPHLGRAKLTPILLVSHPRQYGVWNDYSEGALRAMGLFPDFGEVTKLGDQYAMINEVLVKLAGDYQVSLWWLDIILEQIHRLIRTKS